MTDITPNTPLSPIKQPDDFFRQLDIQLLIHELKGPLSVIESNNRLLLEQQNKFGRLNDAQQRALERSLRCSAKLTNTIHTLLEVGSSESGRICPIRFDAVTSIKKILVDVLETEFHQLKGELQADVDESDGRYEYLMHNGIILDIAPEVEGLMLHQDEVKFGHIINNLLRNALQHKKSRVDVHVALKRATLQIRVKDDGEGIAPEDQLELFRCYTQIKACQRKVREKGHGLGLAGSLILARRLGGDITIDTKCKTGACFILQLPVTPDERETL